MNTNSDQDRFTGVLSISKVRYFRDRELLKTMALCEGLTCLIELNVAKN